MSVAGRCTISEFPCAAAVPASEWDSLLEPDDLQATHRFVRACEEADVEGAEYRHLMIHIDGTLAAVATLCRMRVKLDLLSAGAGRRLIRGVRRFRSGFLEVPVIFCGLPVSFGQSLLRLHPAANAGLVLHAVHDAAERFAAGTATTVVCFKEFTDPELRQLVPLTERGYLQLPSLPSCRLALPFRTFDEYVGAMRSGYRRQLRSSLRKGERLGITVRRVVDFRDECPRLFTLYEQVMDRAEYQLERLNLAFFERLNEGLGRESSALLVERNGRILAAAVLLHAPGLTTFLLSGIDYSCHRKLASYPILVAEVVREAIRSGTRELEMGQTSYVLKQRLGAATSGRHLFLRYRGAVGHRLLALGSRALFPVLHPRGRRVFNPR